MKIAIVHSNATIVDKLIRALAHVQTYKILWTARDEAEAIAKCRLNTPDLILLDLSLPEARGVSTCFEIMKKSPCAILIMTSNMTSDISQIFEAMGHGALDAIALNWTKVDMNAATKAELLNKIETIAKLLGKGSNFKMRNAGQEEKNVTDVNSYYPPLVVIGASTGGPAAIAKILSSFPKKTAFATVIIQHVDEKFSKGMAEWLSIFTPLPVKLAKEGSLPSSGTILVAAHNQHLLLTPSLRLKYSHDPIDSAYSPSIDVFFESAALYWPIKSIGVLLTGMGNDGAKGLKALKNAGWYTIAEDEKSCIVYGMPKAAIALGAATTVLELDLIGPSITSFLEVIPQPG